MWGNWRKDVNGAEIWRHHLSNQYKETFLKSFENLPSSAGINLVLSRRREDSQCIMIWFFLRAIMKTAQWGLTVLIFPMTYF